MRPLITGAAAGGGHLMEKQSISSNLVPAAEELWKAWEIHSMILLSLFLQVFLFLFGGLRQRCSGRLVSSVLWLAYLSADVVAIFVLGHLAVRAREPGHQLMSFWAPFVLVHLGGQDTISAFAKQDNELWHRHALNLVIQAAVAGYVVAKTSWPDRRLRAAVALIFVCGSIKYAERMYILRRADPARLKAASTRSFFWELVRHKLFRHIKRKEKKTEHKVTRVKTIEMMMSRGSAVPQRQLFWYDAWRLVEDDIIAVDAPRNMANDINSASAAAEQDEPLPVILKRFVDREDCHNNAYEYVGALLGHSYRWLYTKDPIREMCISRMLPPTVRRRRWLKILIRTGCLVYILGPCALTSVALALVMAAEKQQQPPTANRADIIVSYLLLVGALALDVSSVATFTFFHLTSHLPPAVLNQLPSCIQPSWSSSNKHWSQKLGQYNMLRRARKAFSWRSLLGSHVKRTSISKDGTPIKKFILDTLLTSGAAEQWAIASTRGMRALVLHRSSLHEPSSSSSAAALTALKETITCGADLPTSVLILHIATDICYYHGEGNGSDDGDQEDKQVEEHKQISRQLSDYIMYLVFKCGVMLALDSQVLHDKALDEIEDILSWRNREKSAAMMILEQGSKYQVQVERHGVSEERRATDSAMPEIPIEDGGMKDAVNNDVNNNHMKKLLNNFRTLKSPVLPRACEVAKEFISIKDGAARWKLIAEVWAEMLYYITPRCGGGFHYDHLSKGGEFVTHVLVLMYYLGPFMPPPDA